MDRMDHLDHLELTGDELAAIVASGSAVEVLSAAAGVAMVTVDMTSSTVAGGSRAHGALDAVGTLPCVVVARVSPATGPTWWELAERVDILLTRGDPADGAEGEVASLLERGTVTVTADDEHRLSDAVLRAPLAAASLAVLLRGVNSRNVTQGLEAESTLYSLLQAGPEFAAWQATRTVQPRFDDTPDAVTVDRRGDTLVVTLSRPHVHNALNRCMRDELAEALTQATTDHTIASVELCGAGPSFSSGGDLREFGLFPDPVTSHLTRLTRSPARLLSRIGSRTTAHLHGACMGGGIELAAFAGTVTAAADTVIALPELALGLIPGAGGTVSIPRRIGRHRAGYLALSGARIDAMRALRWGLVDELTEG